MLALRWTVRIRAGRHRRRKEELGESDLSVRGSASDLYLSFGTGSSGTAARTNDLELVGRQDLISSWRDHSHLTWS